MLRRLHVEFLPRKNTALRAHPSRSDLHPSPSCSWFIIEHIGSSGDGGESDDEFLSVRRNLALVLITGVSELRDGLYALSAWVDVSLLSELPLEGAPRVLLLRVVS